MNILGLSNEHDSGVAFIEDGRILFAANEERFRRVKFCMDAPQGAFRAGAKQFPDFVRRIDAVAVSSRVHIGEHIAVWSDDGNTFMRKLVNGLSFLRLHRALFGTLWGARLTMTVLRLTQLSRTLKLRRLLAQWGVRAPITYVDHHTGHVASTYYTSPWRRALVVTLDSHGDGVCSRAFLGEGGTLRELHAIPFLHSPGHYYVYVTFILGFTPGREGKVTGLAARGHYEETLPIFQSRLSLDEANLRFVDHGRYRYNEVQYLRGALKGFSREDIAAGIQKHLEDLVTAYVSGLIKRYIGEPIPVVLAGGVFANVLLNQRIKELPDVLGVYVYPHMGDGGLAAGSAMWVEAQHRGGLEPQPLHDAYLGSEYAEEEVERALKARGCTYRKSRHAAEDVAKLLAAGKVVAVFRGRMEYGPRALGNRSILYGATDPAVNDWLNVRLKRSEFMPFAPILRKEHIDLYFKEWRSCEKALEFMTVTLDATDIAKKEAPAIVHVDGTARPQVVLRDVNRFMDDVLRHYEKLSGFKVLVNTSFNMHEEPIVATPEDALRAFFDGQLDALALESCIVEKS